MFFILEFYWHHFRHYCPGLAKSTPSGPKRSSGLRWVYPANPKRFQRILAWMGSRFSGLPPDSQAPPGYWPAWGLPYWDVGGLRGALPSFRPTYPRADYHPGEPPWAEGSLAASFGHSQSSYPHQRGPGLVGPLHPKHMWVMFKKKLLNKS